jgi:hypothetical protein
MLFIILCTIEAALFNYTCFACGTASGIAIKNGISFIAVRADEIADKV